MTIARHDQVVEQALDWIAAGKGAAIATVIQTWGSAPRPTGSQLAISSEAELAGSVSGGCVEGAVAAEALDALQDGLCRVLSYGVSDEEAFAVGLACGGEIRILVEPVGVGDGPDIELLNNLAAARANRKAVVLAVNLESWSRHLAGGPELSDSAAIALQSGVSALDGDWFLGVHNPPLRLVIVGAVHIAQALMPMAKLAGYDATLIDPREAFATDLRFPGEQMIVDWPEDALKQHGLDQRTAVVTLTHDPKLDDPAITAALKSTVYYLGCLGSKKTHAKRVDRLIEAGFSQEDISRIHGPVGLDIGAKSPAEIAVSILAEMTERLRRPAG